MRTERQVRNDTDKMQILNDCLGWARVYEYLVHKPPDYKEMILIVLLQVSCKVEGS